MGGKILLRTIVRFFVRPDYEDASEAPRGKPRRIFTSSAEPAEANPPFHPPQ
jgi:hypothetical protein